MIGIGCGVAFGGGSPSPWTPAALGADLAAWYDATYGITLNGSNVALWLDKSGKGATASQGTAGDQPAFTASWRNGMPALAFAGDWLDATLSAALTNATIIVAGTFANNNNTAAALTIADGSINTGCCVWRGTNQLIARATWRDAVIASTNDPCVVSGVMTTTRSDVWLNGVAGTPYVGAIALAASPRLLIGRQNPAGSAALTGAIAEIIVAAGSMSSANRVLCERYLGTKYGIAVA